MTACQWFAMCDHDATTTEPHPVLGDVPICDRCATKIHGLQATTRNTNEGNTTMDTTYPHIEVELIGEDGNAFAIIGRVSKAIRREEGTEASMAFTKTAMECDSYDDLLAFVMRTVDVV